MIVTKYLAATVGLYGHWGRGNTPKEARKQCLEAGGKTSDRMTIYQNVYDDEFGWKDTDGSLLTKKEMQPCVNNYGMTCHCGEMHKTGEWVKGKWVPAAEAAAV